MESIVSILALVATAIAIGYGIWRYAIHLFKLGRKHSRKRGLAPSSMDQPSTNVTNADLDRIVRREFPAERVSEVLALLEEYGREEWHNEVLRVRAAVLKLASGDVERLRTELEIAKSDWRDALAQAEYPGYCRFESGGRDVPPEEVARISRADWKQYQEWFNR